jgi:CRISPR-associated protein Cmr2
MTASSLLIWTCGPVQDFIASARKGRDLWFGSWVLSEVSTAAAKALLDLGGDLILPAPDSAATLQQPDYDVPNRVLAMVSGVSPCVAAEKASAAARLRLRALADDVFDHIEKRRGALASFDLDRAKEQIDDLLEVAWAATAATGDERADRRRVEGLLAARKSLRSFRSPTFASWHVPKNSLDGQREAVTVKNAGLRLGLGHDERLCGVGLLKRLGHEVAPKNAPGGRVASVSMFSLLSWLRPALQRDAAEVRSAIEDFGQALRDGLRQLVEGPVFQSPHHPLFGTLDPHAFYASRLHEVVKRGSDLVAAERCHQAAFVGLVDRLDLPREPNAYLAVLVGDGDRLGKMLDGLDHAGVRAVSRVLSKFANHVRTGVLDPDNLEGICVYAGGDDVLAFVPVDVALRKARELSEAFEAAFRTAIEAGDLQNVESVPTFSVGIGVAHHLAPLRDTLDAARAAEKIAKQDADRDAWAVRIIKRSGGTQDLYGKWNDGSDRDLVALAYASGAHGVLPRGLAHSIHQGGMRADPDLSGVRYRPRPPGPLEFCELERVMQQKLPKVTDEAQELRLAQARGLLQKLHHQRGLRDLANRLIAARTLSGMGGVA